ncbi:MAG: sialate O-acetylesterase [Planctomycetota bacterium]
MIHLFFLILSALGGACAPSLPEPEDLQIFLLIGQSNMAGRSPIEAADQAPLPRLYLFDDADRWVPATHPFNQYSTIRKGLELQRMNPGYGFAGKWLEKHPGSSLGLIVNARGATKIERWQKGERFYDEALRRTRNAVHSGRLRGILWHQGETNCHDPNYLEKLKMLIHSFRTDLGIPDLPFIAGQIHGDWPVNLQLARLSDEMSRTGCALADDLQIFETWHFDAASMRILGERYADEAIRIENSGEPGAR